MTMVAAASRQHTPVSPLRRIEPEARPALRRPNYFAGRYGHLQSLRTKPGEIAAFGRLLAQSVGNCATALFVSLPTDRGRMILSPAVEMMLTK